MRFRLSIAVLATLIAIGCAGNTGGDPGTGPGTGNPNGPGTVTPPPRPNQTGMLAFSTTASRGWNSIDVYVDNAFVGTLRKYYGSGDTPASCVPDGDARVVTTVPVGAHTYTARSNTGATWNGSHTISSSGSCMEINLTCGSDGDCSR